MTGKELKIDNKIWRTNSYNHSIGVGGAHDVVVVVEITSFIIVL